MIALVASGVVLLAAAGVGIVTFATSHDDGPAFTTGDAIEDGVISFTEYERAVVAAMECARANSPEGTSHTAFLDRSGRYYRFASSAPTNELSDRAAAAFDSCTERWLAPIERVWNEQETITAEELPEALGTFIECVNRAGAEIPGPVRDAIAKLDTVRPAAEQPDVRRWAYDGVPEDKTIPDCIETAGLGNLSNER